MTATIGSVLERPTAGAAAKHRLLRRSGRLSKARPTTTSGAGARRSSCVPRTAPRGVTDRVRSLAGTRQAVRDVLLCDMWALIS
jgi:uncharacterized alpha-E superfamily protein